MRRPLLDKLVASGGEVISVGKISDIYAHQGITKKIKATGNAALFDATLDALRDGRRSHASCSPTSSTSTCCTDTVATSTATRPRSSIFDPRLPEMLELMQDDDVLMICADHGCDPTWPGSDHTREHIPVLAYGAGVMPGPLGKRDTFADIGQSLATYLRTCRRWSTVAASCRRPPRGRLRISRRTGHSSPSWLASLRFTSVEERPVRRLMQSLRGRRSRTFLAENSSAAKRAIPARNVRTTAMWQLSAQSPAWRPPTDGRRARLARRWPGSRAARRSRTTAGAGSG